MRRVALIAALSAMSLEAQAQTPADPDAWMPGPDLVSDLDAQAVQLQLRGANAPLDSY